MCLRYADLFLQNLYSVSSLSYYVYNILNIYKFHFHIMSIRQPVRQSVIPISNTVHLSKMKGGEQKKRKTVIMFSLIRYLGTIIWFIVRMKYDSTRDNFTYNVVLASELTCKRTVHRSVCVGVNGSTPEGEVIDCRVTDKVFEGKKQKEIRLSSQLYRCYNLFCSFNILELKNFEKRLSHFGGKC